MNNNNNNNNNNNKKKKNNNNSNYNNKEKKKNNNNNSNNNNNNNNNNINNSNNNCNCLLADALKQLLKAAMYAQAIPNPAFVFSSERDNATEARRRVQLDAAWILTKVSASSSALTAQMVTQGAVEHFIRRVADEDFDEMRVQVGSSKRKAGGKSIEI